MPDSLRDMTRPGYRRNMTQEEIDALYGEQGIEPTLPPFGTSAAALATDYLSIPVQQLLSELSGGSPTMLAVARWKKANLPQNLRQLVESVRLAPKTDPISQRQTVFHATDPQSVEPILKAGEIVPEPRVTQALGRTSWRDVTRLQSVGWDKKPSPEALTKVRDLIKTDQRLVNNLDSYIANRYGSDITPAEIDQELRQWLTDPSSGDLSKSGYGLLNMMQHVFGRDDAARVLADLGYRYESPGKVDVGVSVSRVPRVSSKGSKAVSFVLDPEKMPPSRPYAEMDYQKTVGPDPYTGEVYPNPRFEFENRTWNQAIPLTAAREMWVDKSALPGAQYQRPDNWINPTMLKTHEAELQFIRDLASQYNLPLREFESGLEMHRGRTTLSDLTRKKR